MGRHLSGYLEALEYLFSRTTGASRLGLERTEALLALLGNPHRRVPSLHVAGTNGKGSVATMAEALLRARGLRVGMYTSPHLVDFRERILIDQRPVAEDAVVAFIERWMPDVERIGATFFEATTAMAFDCFAAAGVDAMVIEVGLGGRLDATNVVRPAAAAVTSVGLDHTALLGDTIERIAVEKAGIFKPRIPAVIGESQPATRALLVALAEAQAASPVYSVFDATEIEELVVSALGTTFTAVTARGRRTISVPLAGRHQAGNALVALALVDAGRIAGATVSEEDEARALASVRLSGRFQMEPPYIFDVAHNPAAAAALAATLAAVAPPGPIVALLSVLADKDWRGVIRALSVAVDEFVITTAPTAPESRAWDGAEACAFARAQGWRAEWVADFDRGLERAAERGATVLVTGSFHTVGDAMARLQVSPFPA